jgi:hypothetical protein
MIFNEATMSEGTWTEWQSRMAGDSDEDLALVFAHVRPDDEPAAREACAREPTTRAFCDLALRLLHRNTIEYVGSEPTNWETSLLSIADGEVLERYAAEIVDDPGQVAALIAERWQDIWQAPQDFIHDVLAYLFRLGPYLRRIRLVHLTLIDLMKTGLTFGPFVRRAVDMETKSILADPLAALQTSVQATFPTHPQIRTYVRRLEGSPLQLWARLYAVVFPAYGLELQPDTSWFDVADIYTTVADGQILQARSHDSPARLTSGEVVLSAVILGMMPSLFQIGSQDLETLPLLRLPDDSLDWLKRHKWEEVEDR